MRIYLDTWAWIDLAKAAQGGGQGDAALNIAREAVQAGTVAFPLSPISYQEHVLGSATRQRESIGSVMWELSQGRTMIGVGDALLDCEVEGALYRRFGRPFVEAVPTIFGKGVYHAFGKPDRIAALAEQVLESRRLRGENAQPALVEAVRGLMERALLCNPTRDHLLLSRKQHRSFDEKFVAQQEARSTSLATFPKARWLDAAYATKLCLDIIPSIERICTKRATAFPALGRSAEWLTALLQDVPTLWAWTILEEAQRTNPQRPWERQDHPDVAALSVAIVYCDAVLFDKHWSHIARSRHVGARHGTRILRSLEELAALLREVSSIPASSAPSRRPFAPASGQ